MIQPRRTFGPVVLSAGLGAGALAMAGSQTWFVPRGDDIVSCDPSCEGFDAAVGGAGWSMGLVMLAALGVVLVSRGLFRRLVAVVGLLAAVGALVAVVESYVTDPDEVKAAAELLGATNVEVSASGWFWIAAVAAVVSVGAWLAAVANIRSWPEMGRRYDAPADTPPDDLWKALDHGHDPTA